MVKETKSEKWKKRKNCIVDTVLAQYSRLREHSPHSQRLRRLGVGIVIDYVDNVTM